MKSGAVYDIEMNNMLASVESSNLLDEFLNQITYKITSKRKYWFHGIQVDEWTISIKPHFWKTFKSIKKNIEDTVVHFPLLRLGIYERHEFKVSIERKDCFTIDETKKYNDLKKQLNDIHHEAEMIQDRYCILERDWEIECINSGEIVPFYFDNEL